MNKSTKLSLLLALAASGAVMAACVYRGCTLINTHAQTIGTETAPRDQGTRVSTLQPATPAL